MDLRQINYFLAVAQAGGFSKAAQRIHVAQPALSAHVARLEQELGVQLLLRHAKGVELTHAGMVMVEHGHDILRRLKQAQDAVQFAAEEVHGEVVLGLPTTVAMVLTLPLLQQVRTHWPHISLRLIEGHSGWLQEWLLAGRLDAAVLFGQGTRKGLTTLPILEEDLYLVSAPQGTEDESLDVVSMKEVAQHELIVPAKEHGLRIAIDKAAMKADVDLNVKVEIDSFASMKKAVAHGLGHTILSWAAVAEEIERGELVARQITKPKVTRSVVYATRDEQIISRAQQAINQLVTSSIAEMVQSGRWRARLKTVTKITKTKA
jgi:LysR family nitrogen assimilation transcriptional regulator